LKERNSVRPSLSVQRTLRKRLLSSRVQRLADRFGCMWIRRFYFDEMFLSGNWIFEGDAELAKVVTEYGRHGDVLMLGCGGAAVLADLDLSAFQSIHGVDISKEALKLSRRFARPNVTFEQGNMLRFWPSAPYDVIVFSESLYYVPVLRRHKLLRRLSLRLKPGGAFIVTVYDCQIYAEILHMIRAHFRIIEDRSVGTGLRQLIVFRPIE
jgi:SAM-dependent methyltransferase